MGNRDTEWRTTTSGINSQGIFQLLSHSLKCYISLLLQSSSHALLHPASIIHPTLKLLIGYVGGLAEPLIPREFSAEAAQETLHFLLRLVSCGGGNWKVFESELQRSKVFLGVSPDHRASRHRKKQPPTWLALHQSIEEEEVHGNRKWRWFMKQLKCGLLLMFSFVSSWPEDIGNGHHPKEESWAKVSLVNQRRT